MADACCLCSRAVRRRKVATRPPAEGGYPPATTADRWKYGTAYVGLAALLAVLAFGLHSHLHLPAVA